MGVVTDYFLEEVAKVLNSEAGQVPSHLGVATGEQTIATDATSLTGEIGTRIPFNASRTDNTVSFTAIRSSGDVIDTVNGDDLDASGAFGASTGSNLEIGISHAGIVHTINFDLEFTFNVEVTR